MPIPKPFAATLLLLACGVPGPADELSGLASSVNPIDGATSKLTLIVGPTNDIWVEGSIELVGTDVFCNVPRCTVSVETGQTLVLRKSLAGRWSGACSGTQDSCTLTVAGDTVVRAFEQVLPASSTPGAPFAITLPKAGDVWTASAASTDHTLSFVKFATGVPTDLIAIELWRLPVGEQEVARYAAGSMHDFYPYGAASVQATLQSDFRPGKYVPALVLYLNGYIVGTAVGPTFTIVSSDHAAPAAPKLTSLERDPNYQYGPATLINVGVSADPPARLSPQWSEKLKVYRSGGRYPMTMTLPVEPAASWTAAVLGLTVGETYTFSISQLDPVGNESPPTGPFSQTVYNCDTGQITCNGTCVDVSRDRRNCGACGVTLPATQICVGGSPIGPAAGSGISAGAGGARVTFTGTPMVTYDVSATSDFVTWTRLGRATANVHGTFSFIDTQSASARFYQAFPVAVVGELQNVDFGGDGSEVGPAAIGLDDTDLWTVAKMAKVTLKFANGDPSPVQVKPTFPNAAVWGVSTEQPLDPMYSNYVASTQQSNVTLTYLWTGSYGFAVYAKAGKAPQSVTNAGVYLTVSDAAGNTVYTTPTKFTGTSDDAAQWTEDNQYVGFAGVPVGQGQVVTLHLVRGQLSWTILNGLQIWSEQAR